MCSALIDTGSKLNNLGQHTFNLEKVFICLKMKHSRDTLSFFCKECDARYKNRASLQKHIVLKHERFSDSYDCDECDEVFDKKILLTRHKEKKHNLIKKFLCQVDF